MGKDITTTTILSTCARCGETVEHSPAMARLQGFAQSWISTPGPNGLDWTSLCEDNEPHTVDLSHAFRAPQHA